MEARISILVLALLSGFVILKSAGVQPTPDVIMASLVSAVATYAVCRLLKD